MLEPKDDRVDPADWPVLLEYGETEPGKDGCSVRVMLVQTPRGAHRIRLQLRRDGREVKRMDINGPLNKKMLPLLAKAAASEGGES